MQVVESCRHRSFVMWPERRFCRRRRGRERQQIATFGWIQSQGESYFGAEALRGGQEGHGQCLNDEGGTPKCPGPEDNIVPGKQLVDICGNHSDLCWQ